MNRVFSNKKFKIHDREVIQSILLRKMDYFLDSQSDITSNRELEELSLKSLDNHALGWICVDLFNLEDKPIINSKLEMSKKYRELA